MENVGNGWESSYSLTRFHLYLHHMTKTNDMKNNDEVTKKPMSVAQREAINNARNIHVEWLTVGRQTWWRGEQRRLNDEQRHELQFHLRRMWAITFLANMKSHGFNWDGIRKLTGKTRQTWNNVTNSGFVPLHVLKLPSDSDERREYIEGESYRPVTNSFIRKVVTETQKANYSIHTNSFLYACSHGLTAWENDFLDLNGDDQFVIGRLGPNGHTYFNETKGETTEASCAMMDHTGEVVPVDMFPLLGIDDRMINDHFAHEETVAIELVAHGYKDAKTKEPNPAAKMAWEWWKRETDAMREHGEFIEPTPVDPNEFRPEAPTTAKPVQPTINPTIKADDGTPPNADIGGFWVQLPRTEVFPQMINAQRQVAFNVIIQFDENNKPIGSVTMHNPNGGFTVKGM